MAERWGLIVEESKGGRYGFVRCRVLEVVTGSREDALARLEGHATTYQPRQERHPPRTRLFRSADGFLLVGSGAPGEYADDWHVLCRFSAAELLRDSEDTRREAEAERRAQEELTARERAEKRQRRRDR
ncbi:hypothetical protein RVR_2750 [Actinacidiphila reveromycinica]|uniref:Uncharacterized protein n=1 Tax=Actinacidiphila reveromycinica TaxID=659352 RepID=A0A7U3UMT4_9ACTN|nr:hypothetical protein [Streptomyces sp. SN-593]BBA97140.1 hypothetical protein RVR_2750 [Streptomyces sp. SN-593]